MKQNIAQSSPLIAGRNDDGFTLLEVLLSVLVIGMVMAGIVHITKDWTDDEEATLVARHLNQVHDATYDFILSNFDAVFNATPANAAGAIEIPIGTGATVPAHGFVINSTTTDLLPQTFTATNPYGQVLSVMVSRPAFPAATLRTPRVLEVLIVSGGNRISDNKLMKAASIAGGHAGFVSAIDRPGTDCCINTIHGSFGSWSVLDLPNSAYGNTNWFTNNTPNAAGGFLASYLWINQADEIGDYLYNVAVAGVPEANRMFVPLEMGNNDMVGVDDLIVANNANVASGARLHGVAETGTMNVANNNLFAGGIFSDGNINVTGGSISVDDTANINTLNLTGTLNAETATIATTTLSNALNATTLNTGNITGNADTFAESISMNNLTVSGGSLRALDMVVSGTVDTNTVAANEMEVSNTLTGGNMTVDVPATIMELTNFDGTLSVDSFTCHGCP